MSPDKNNSNSNNKHKPPPTKEETGHARKTTTARPIQDPALKCPRCDSSNTKFCYYNNYSLTQPRHFCKTCRRYWTKGGALRNVPVGGGCRKSKKIKPGPQLSSDSKDSISGPSDVHGFKYFQGISPAMDFQPWTPNSGVLSQFSSFGILSNTCGAAISSNPNFTTGTSSSLLGHSFPSFSPGFQEMGNNNLTSSIESLSSINQDLHWKLLRQRLATLFVGDNYNNQKENNHYTSLPSINEQPLVQKPQPILFQNLDVSKADDQSCGRDGGNLSTEWFFDNSNNYVSVSPTPATCGSNLNENVNASNWGGVQAWSDLSQYASLP